ncbi:MAG: MFS transporter, partial [Promethearchaeota archaeon]
IGGAFTLVNPPQGWLPKGWTPPKKEDAKSGTGMTDFTPKEMIHTRQFVFLFIMFVFSATAGLMTIGNYALFAKGTEIANSFPLVTINGEAKRPELELFLTTVGSLAALFNGLGRVVWGKISDNLGRTKTMFIMFSIQAAAMFLFFFMRNPAALLIITCLVYFNFGGNFSLFPSATADFFGTKNFGANYGLVFLAYGIAGILGAFVAGFLGQIPPDYLWAFIPMGALSAVAAVIAILVKPPKK